MSGTVLGWLLGGLFFDSPDRSHPSRAEQNRAPAAPAEGVSHRAKDPLVVAIRAGNERAFQQLFAERYHGLVALAHAYLGDRAAAEDVVQEIFWNLWNRRDGLDASRPIGPYLFSSVRHGVQRLRRRERLAERYAIDVLHDPLTCDTAAFGGPLNEELVERAWAAVATLPERDQEVLDLRLQGLTFAEIGEILGLPLKTVATRTNRAIGRLRQVLFPRR